MACIEDLNARLARAYCSIPLAKCSTESHFLVPATSPGLILGSLVALRDLPAAECAELDCRGWHTSIPSEVEDDESHKKDVVHALRAVSCFGRHCKRDRIVEMVSRILLIAALGVETLAAHQQARRATASATTITSAPAASSSAPSCPYSNNTIYTASSGNQYVIECGVDHAAGDMGSTYVNDSLLECLNVCDSTPGCVDVSLSGAACYLKSTLGTALNDVGIQGARLLTSSTSPSAFKTSSSTTASPTATGPTCPQSNNTVWTDSTGDQYMIECGIDRAQGDIATMDVSSLGQCISKCSSTWGCVDVSLSGVACYMKNSIGAKSYNSDVLGARLVGNIYPSSSSTATATATGAVAAQTPLQCPDDNSTVYTASSGLQYLLSCDADYSGGDSTNVKVSSWSDCIDACDASVNCVALTLSGSACYEKSVVNDAAYAAGMYAARLITSAASSSSATASLTSATASATPTYVSCPASNGTSYTAANGEVFVVECDIDRPGGDLTEVDMTGTVAERFQQCIDTCANTTDCVDVSLSGVACYLKYILAEASYTEGMLGARYIGNASTPAATSAAASATPTVPARTVVFVGGFEYLACYSDSITNRTLGGSNVLYSSAESPMTLEVCEQYCSSFGYFGWVSLDPCFPLSISTNRGSSTEAGSTCYCGDSIAGTASTVAVTECQTPCDGNSTEICGGASGLSLYHNRNVVAAPVSSSTSIPSRFQSTTTIPASTSPTASASSSPSSSIYANFTSTTFGYAPSGSAAPTETASVATSTSTEVETAIVSPVPAGRSVEYLLRYSRRGRKYGA
ncbi:PAN domain [Teratosphaeria destructans]|uniref:PAN domain n=1 Tax=Teratosphaeria destructans TaxID=418781 RepID=A0A9W7STW5_9PEZI|nr:PAN domain [Teratosphaeria destructans]